ncbi:DNA primase [Actinomadura sp. 1N219]|uniref:DNA primase n=1 Tax=Actinomadura sp. 1N219 TaxID=3375152 RepID=UPI0037BA0317
MAGRIRNEDIALVRERSSIADVIGEYLQLRNAGGGNLKGLCPFHDEKSPSFNVTPSRGLYFCFGCEAGGDVIKFVQEIEHLSFSDAVERLAVQAGVQLRYEDGGGRGPRQDGGQRARLIEAHRAAAEYYIEQLNSADGAIGRTFLSERGFEPADAERFGVGFAPREWEGLVRHLRGRGFADRDIVAGGLAKEGRRGPMDRFRGRLMWPIRDLSGDVIGFGARRLYEDDDGPKYLNTPESPLFHKGSVLYGADLAKKEIARRRQAVVVEGYTDVMACHLAGVPTAIATSGTAFGDEHIKVLRRLLMDQDEFRGEVIFTFDGDAAGRKAALRAFDDEQKFVSQTFVAIQPDGLDPCDLRIRHGDAAVRDLVASRLPLFEFAVRSAIEQHDLDTVEGRLSALDAAAPVVAAIKDRSRRHMYAVNLDRWLGIMDEQFVLRRVRELANRRHGRPQNGNNRSGNNSGNNRGGNHGAGDDRGRAGNGPAGNGRAGNGRDSGGPAENGGNENGRYGADGAGAGRPAFDPSDPEVQRERELLKLAVQRPAVLGPAFDDVPADAFIAPPHAAVRMVIADAGGVSAAGNVAEWVAHLLERAPDDQVRDLITKLGVEPSRSAQDSGDRYAVELLARIQERQLTRMIASAKSKLGRLNPVEAPEEYHRLFGDLVALEQQRRVLRERGLGSQ